MITKYASQFFKAGYGPAIVLVIDTIKISQLGRCLLRLFLVEECNIRPKHGRAKPLKVLPSYNLILPFKFRKVLNQHENKIDVSIFIVLL